jgi:hypothetical protein
MPRRIDPNYPFDADYNKRKFKPYFVAIGKMSAMWARFEFTLDDIIWELANVSPKAGTCLTSQWIGPRPRFRCLVALLHLRGSNKRLVNDANSISSTAESLSQQRNRYVHDQVVSHLIEKTFYRMETTADKKIKHHFVPLEINDITNLIDKIDALQKNLERLHAMILSETPPWHRTEYEQSGGIRRQRQEKESSRAKF